MTSTGLDLLGAEVDAPIHQTGFDVKAEEPENTDEAST